MAVEQDWAAYTDQGHLKATDTLLARTSGGAGVEVPGDHIVARRANNGPATLFGPGQATTSLSDSGSLGDALYLKSNALGPGSGGALILGSAFGSTDSFFAAVKGSITDGASRTQGDLVLCTRNTVTDTFLTPRLIVATNGNTRPGGDNLYSLGISSSRWSVVYAATGTINTSDEREKEWRGGLTDAELRAAKRIAAELGFYRWLDAVAEKGDAARYHFGARAQQVWTIMAEEGLIDPIEDGLPGKTPYAFLCFDEWGGGPTKPAQPEVRGKDGKIITPGFPEVPAEPAGNRYGLRTDQLALFLIAAQEQRLLALEALL